MAFDLLIKNGRIIDGSGMPSFRGDLAVKDGKIVEMGKFNSPATRTIDASGLAVSPGVMDIHCHYDAQVTWDPLCTCACYHGSTTVIIGNCSLALAPIRRDPEGIERALGFLSYVEAIPMEVLRSVDITWESVPEYMDVVGKGLGVNMGMLVGHSPLRYYVMGSESQTREESTKDEIKEMQKILHEAMEAGALGFSISTNRTQFDPQGNLIPSVMASEEELFGLGDVLGEFGTGCIQVGGGREAEQKNRLMSRLSASCGRPVLWNNLLQSVIRPNQWKELMAIVDETTAAGIRSYPLCNTNVITTTFTMKNCQTFDGSPSWRPILVASDEEKMKAYRDPAFRQKIHEEVVEWKTDLGRTQFGRDWYNYMVVIEPVLEKNMGLKGKTVGQVAEEQGKGVIDAFLDLVVEEELNTTFRTGNYNVDNEAAHKILNYPNTIIGQSDGGAHVQFKSESGYATYILGKRVREEKVMPLEQAIRRFTFEAASAFGIVDRGLLRPGLAADIMIFDPETVGPLEEEVMHDFPNGGWRVGQLAQGIKYTIVNGEVLLEDGKHTGALPGQLVRNSMYKGNK